MTFITHPISGEIEITELKSMAASNRVPYPHVTCRVLCEKVEELEEKNKILIQKLFDSTMKHAETRNKVMECVELVLTGINLIKFDKPKESKGNTFVEINNGWIDIENKRK